jgi:putative pyruvate formate lyase activating enzyme
LCGADRLAGETGFCRAGLLPRVAAESVHLGEEPPLSGTRGAGNIFFSGCNLACRFCQNFPISQQGVGRELTITRLAAGMLRLQARGVHNINLVTATHLAPQAATAVDLARRLGLAVPVAWNSNGYERPETITLLRDVVDIWLPDMKYASDGHARRISGVADYVQRNREAVAAMLAQAGPLALDRRGLARRGVLVRHLVLPGDLAGTGEVLDWLLRHGGPSLPLSLMFQYFPAHLTHGDPLLGRRLTPGECAEATAEIRRHGFQRGWLQEEPGGEGCGLPVSPLVSGGISYPRRRLSRQGGPSPDYSSGVKQRGVRHGISC